MSSILYAGAGTVVVPPLPSEITIDWRGVVTMTLTTPQGVIFDLLNGTQGVYLTNDGTRGLNMPPVDRQATELAGVPGSVWRGHRVKEREVFLPLLVFSDNGSVDWLERDEALWDGLVPDAVCTWTISTTRGTRSLLVRFVGDGDPSSDHDPSASGWEVYGVTMVAEEPFWRGSHVVQEWYKTTPVPFFQSDGMHVSRSSRIETATLTNPGKVEAYPVWTIFGPTTSVTVGVNGKTDTIPWAIPDGKAVILDTRPTVRSAFDANVVVDSEGTPQAVKTGVNLTSSLTGASSFAAIPAGASVPLSLAMVGTGVVRAEIVPQFYRALA